MVGMALDILVRYIIEVRQAGRLGNLNVLLLCVVLFRSIVPGSWRCPGVALVLVRLLLRGV
jgi:hypothetical protein